MSPLTKFDKILLVDKIWLPVIKFRKGFITYGATVLNINAEIIKFLEEAVPTIKKISDFKNLLGMLTWKICNKVFRSH